MLFYRKTFLNALLLKVLSHQIRSAWKWFGWIGLVEYMDRGWLKDFLILPPFVNLNFSSPSGIAKHDRCWMQFADSAGKFASGAQFCIYKELQPLFYSYLKVLKVISVSVFQNGQTNPEITFVKLLKKVCLLFKTHCKKGNRLPFAISPKVIWALMANCLRLIEYRMPFLLNFTEFACGASLPFDNLLKGLQ